MTRANHVPARDVLESETCHTKKCQKQIVRSAQRHGHCKTLPACATHKLRFFCSNRNTCRLLFHGRPLSRRPFLTWLVIVSACALACAFRICFPPTAQRTTSQCGQDPLSAFRIARCRTQRLYAAKAGYTSHVGIRLYPVLCRQGLGHTSKVGIRIYLVLCWQEPDDTQH